MRKHQRITRQHALLLSQSKKNLPKETSNQEFYFSIWKLFGQTSTFSFLMHFHSLSSNQGNLCSWRRPSRYFLSLVDVADFIPGVSFWRKELSCFPKQGNLKRKKKKGKWNHLSCDIRLQLASMKPERLMSLGSRRDNTSLIMLSHKTFEAMAITGTQVKW